MPCPCPVWLSGASATWPLSNQCQFQGLDLFLEKEDLQLKDFNIILGTLLHIEQALEKLQHACSPGVVLDGVCTVKVQHYKYLEVVERGAQHVQHWGLHQGCHYCCNSEQTQAVQYAQCTYGKEK